MHAAAVGLLLAAGEGRRMGGPKALVTGPDGTPWVVSAARMLAAAGCAPVRVVVGAAADDVRALLSDVGVDVVVATDWAEGMGASLRAGLTGLDRLAPAAAAAAVHLVDLPDVDASVVRRVVEHASAGGLARAVFAGTPGHPVLLGRDHWAAIAASATGDEGARDYLASRSVLCIECSDLAGGHDVDTRG